GRGDRELVGGPAVGGGRGAVDGDRPDGQAVQVEVEAGQVLGGGGGDDVVAGEGQVLGVVADGQVVVGGVVAAVALVGGEGGAGGGGGVGGGGGGPAGPVHAAASSAASSIGSGSRAHRVRRMPSSSRPVQSPAPSRYARGLWRRGGIARSGPAHPPAHA